MKKACAACALLAALALPLADSAWSHPDDEDIPLMPMATLALDKSGKEPVFRVSAGMVDVPTAGATGVLTIRRGDRIRDLELVPTGMNGMKLKQAAQVEPGASVHAAVTLADKQVVSAEFTLD
jgi:hypothetical protein